MKIQQNIPLAPLTTFRIGGPARFFSEAENEAEIRKALEFAKKHNLEYFILGGGSNVLVSDKGFDGLVIKIHDTKYIIHDTCIECGAGLLLSEAVKIASENSLSGLEWAAGIPGTVGGAVRGNAGAFGGAISDLVDKVKVLVTDIAGNVKNSLPNFQFPSTSWRTNFQSISNDENFKVLLLNKEHCGFEYRNSVFKNNKDLIIVSAILKLHAGNKKEIDQKMDEIFRKRSMKQPKGFSAGSFFVNPVVNDARLLKEFEEETGQTPRGKTLPAGWLVARAGLIGRAVGGAKVSDAHGNFIINTGSATAEDVLILASIIKQRVRDEFGVLLREEVQLVGF